MQYKTMVLGLLQQQPRLHEQLRRNRKLLSTMDEHARELKVRHEELRDDFSQWKTAVDPSQVSNAALEMALKELQERLKADSLPEESIPLSLDAAMAFLRHRSSQA